MYLMFSQAAVAAFLLLGHAAAQETRPQLVTKKCTSSGGCVAQNTSVVLDTDSRKKRTSSGGTDYAAMGVTTSGDALTLQHYVNGFSASPRVYLLDEGTGKYVLMELLNNQELTVDVDFSNVPCGENGAFYLSEMTADGSKNPGQFNSGGAALGNGYCDAQCQGYCCGEMDILEANSRANAFTPHPCGANDCDKSGCGFNPYAAGHQGYYGPGGSGVDTNKPFTVVTQFATDSGAAGGTLTSVTRKYVQNGKVVASATGAAGGDSVTSCSSAAQFGGLATMGQALGRGMVLVFSIWNDNGQFMNWLDSGSAGPCSATEGNPSLIQQQHPGTHVVFSNIRWGDIGSTFQGSGSGGGGTTTTSKQTTSTSKATTTATTKPPSGATQTHYGQCGGQGYSGPTACAAPYACQTANPYYAQCL